MCSSKMPKESGRLKSRLVRSRSRGEKLWEREGKALRRKKWKQRAKPINQVPFWPQFLWVTCVFLKLKLCALWRSAAHSMHDNFPIVHCGPKKVYAFEVCGFIASARIKFFFKKVEFFNDLFFAEMSSQMLRIGQWNFIGHSSDYFTTSFKAGPLQALLVIFGRRALIFLFESSWKNMKNDTTFVRMRSGDHLEDAKCRKRAPRSVEFNFFINCDRQKLN